MSVHEVDDTLSSIRPSEGDILQSEVTYLFPRDPSIISYGQRPLPLGDTKKNLYSLYEDEECDSIDQSSRIPSVAADTIKVYLRMKPLPAKLKLSKQEEQAYEIINSTTLLTRLPSLDKNTSALKKHKGSDTVIRKFMFTNTFGPETTQLELFEQAVKQQLVDFINGRSSTIMSYGTTNAGKSYTLQGTTMSPGIIPRGLEFLFNTISPRSTPCYKPVYNNDVIVLDATDRTYEHQLKTKLLSFGSVDKHQYINAYRSMQKILHEESPCKPNNTDNAHYSVWVSFAEIYNEVIYDLLSTDYQKKRPPLKLSSDSHGKAFIKGLRTVCVTSGSEAYQVLMVGQENLKVAATALNAKSSRSHCIFTIKLLKYYQENSASKVEVSTLSFCDLAGSERLKKTLNAGERLKEAQNINTSLLVLGRCLKSIWDLQTSRLTQEITGPFRESKLTRLFQSALSGKEQIALIVNVNPVPNLYAETQNVLNFSAIAKQIIVEPATRNRRRSSTKFSQLVSQSVKTTTDWDATELESVDEESCQSIDKSEYVHVEDYDELKAENDELKKKIAEMKTAAMNKDYEIRQELSSVYTEMMKKLETKYKNRMLDAEEQQQDMLAWSVSQVEHFYKEKLREMRSNRKRSRCDSDEGSTDDEACIEELEAENHQLTAKVASLKDTIKELRDQKEKLYMENNRITFELSLAQKDLKTYVTLLQAAQNDIASDDGSKQLVDELKLQLEARDNANKALKDYLNEAKEEWIKSTENEALLEKQLKEKNILLLELTEKNTDLIEQVEYANACLAKNTKTIEHLEEELESCTKSLVDTEEKAQNMEEKYSKTYANNSAILRENEELRNVIENKTNPNSVDLSTKDKEESTQISQLTTESEKLRNKIAEQDQTLVMLNSKLTEAEAENNALKTKLTQNSNETKLLGEELNATKTTLVDITKQIQILRIVESSKTETSNADSQTSFRNDHDVMEAECRSDSDILAGTSNDDEYRRKISKLEEVYEEITENLKTVTTEYANLKSLHVEETERVKALNEELAAARAEMSNSKSLLDFENMEKEYSNSVKLMEHKMDLLINEKTKVEVELQEKRNLISDLEQKVSDHKSIIDTLQSDVQTRQVDCQQNAELLNHNEKTISSLQRQLSEATDKLQVMSSECSMNHVKCIDKLEKDILAAKERENLNAEILETHVERITKLEKDLEEFHELGKDMATLQTDLETCKTEKLRLEKEVEENQEKSSLLEKKLQESTNREHERENEISMLQKEVKTVIHSNTKSDVNMEKEMKSALKKLTETQEKLVAAEEALESLKKATKSEREKLEIRLNTFEQNATYVALLQEGAENRQAENERLRKVNDELQKKLDQNRLEMESFSKNREEMMQRYEALVKQLQEDAERNKREVTRYQELFLRQSTPTPHKEEIRKLKDELRSKTSLIEQLQDHTRKTESRKENKENHQHTSEDEHSEKEVRPTRRRGRPPTVVQSTPANDDVAIIELSGSETRRTRRTALAPPATAPVAEKRRPRKKKLFTPSEDSIVDIEPSEPSEGHSLRTRKPRQ